MDSAACPCRSAVTEECTCTAGMGREEPPLPSDVSAGSANVPAAGSGGDQAPPTPSTSAPASVVAKPELIPEPIDEASYVFDPTQLRAYNLIVAPSDLAMIDQAPSAEVYIPAGMEFEGKSYGPYRMRYKGSAGAWDPPCTLGAAILATPKFGKCSIKVDFDVDNGAEFFGLKKLNFHSMIQDPSMLRERLAYALFRQMGVAAPRAVHARLSINGKLEGLFALVEQIDGRFTRSRFGDGGGGNLYKEVWPTSTDPNVYVAALETNTKHPNVERMLDFKTAVDGGPNPFSQFIDRDYMLRYIAVDRVIINDDGVFHFWCQTNAQGNNPGEFGNHNYYWYEAQDTKRFWLIPWDLDFALSARPDAAVYPEWTTEAPCECGYPMYGIQRPASCDTLVSNLKTWLDLYNAKVDEFIAGPFARDRVEPQLDLWAEQIRAVVSEAAGVNHAPTLEDWTLAVSQFKTDLANARSARGRSQIVLSASSMQ
jgi:spore coat protein H